MSKEDAQKIAREYVMKHQDHYRKATKKEIKAAVDKVAKALSGLEPTDERYAKPAKTASGSDAKSRS